MGTVEDATRAIQELNGVVSPQRPLHHIAFSALTRNSMDAASAWTTLSLIGLTRQLPESTWVIVAPTATPTTVAGIRTRTTTRTGTVATAATGIVTGTATTMDETVAIGKTGAALLPEAQAGIHPTTADVGATLAVPLAAVAPPEPATTTLHRLTAGKDAV